jgi:hypothetical protein
MVFVVEATEFEPPTLLPVGTCSFQLFEIKKKKPSGKIQMVLVVEVTEFKPSILLPVGTCSSSSFE